MAIIGAMSLGRPIISQPQIANIAKVQKMSRVYVSDEPASNKFKQTAKVAISMYKKTSKLGKALSVGEFYNGCVNNGHDPEHCAAGAVVATTAEKTMSTASGRIVAGSLAAVPLTGGISVPASLAGVVVGGAGLCVAEDVGKACGHATVRMLESRDGKDDDKIDERCNIM